MKEYPAFIIDRSRRSAASRFTDDFVVCTDREVGFIARAYSLPKSRRAEFAQAWLADPHKYCVKVIGEAVAVLEIVHFLHEPVAHINRVPPLMRKALKAYIYGERQAVDGDGSAIDLQISAVEDIVRLSYSQRERIANANGVKGAEAFINALESAVDSLKLLKEIIKK